MIKQHCCTNVWFEVFKKQKDHRRIDKIILEKMIFALHLLERLKSNGLEFVFKGGTSLVLSPITYVEGQDSKGLTIEDPNWNSLMRPKNNRIN